MKIRFDSNGHGKGDPPGKIALTNLGSDCSVLYAAAEDPPPDKDMAIRLTNLFIQWMAKNKANVRHTLPMVRDGQTIALFVWHEPLD